MKRKKTDLMNPRKFIVSRSKTKKLILFILRKKYKLNDSISPIAAPDAEVKIADILPQLPNVRNRFRLF